MTNFILLALAATGEGISGSDRIFIEFARRWAKNYPVKIYVWEEGFKMCQRQGLDVPGIKYQVSYMEPWRRLGFIVNYFARIIEGVRIGLTSKIKDPENTIVYSTSEFWMDSIPGLILRVRFPKIIWVAAWFQTAPNPFIGFAEGQREERYRLKSLVYFLMQLPIKPLIKSFTNFVLVNNEEEKKQFPNLSRKDRALVVLGAVNIEEIGTWKLKFKNLPKIYDGVFQGRFHPQKGALELIDIWKLVVDKKKDAKLIMIGDGPLMERVKGKVKREKLEKNVKLTGYLFDGPQKYEIFARSKLVVHPAFYDSGGMAAAEAMAFGLPCVGFNLKSYESYYPKGMVKVPIGNLEGFAGEILNLLSNNKLYANVAEDALEMINGNWSWQKRADGILSLMVK